MTQKKSESNLAKKDSLVSILGTEKIKNSIL